MTQDKLIAMNKDKSKEINTDTVIPASKFLFALISERSFLIEWTPSVEPVEPHRTLEH